MLGAVPSFGPVRPVTTAARLTVVLRPSRATTVAVTAYMPAVEKTWLALTLPTPPSSTSLRAAPLLHSPAR